MSLGAITNAANARRAEDFGYIVRSTQVADAERIGEVHVQVWRETYRSLMPAEYLDGLDAEEFAARWRTWIAYPRPAQARHVVGIHPNGTIVGIGSAGPSRDPQPPTEWELWAINLLGTEAGSGLPDLMMASLVGDADCSLWVLPENRRAVAFYSRYGFRADGVTKPHPPTGATETRMVRVAATKTVGGGPSRLVMDPEASVRTHPVHAFTARLHEWLDDLANTSHLGMSVQDQGETVVELDRAIARLEGLKLRVLAAADRNDVGEATAATTPGWLATATLCDRRRARKDVKLAWALEGYRHRTGEALVGGAVSAEHAEVIVDAVDGLPREVGPEGREKAELHLLEQAARFSPKELKLLARHLYEVIDPEAAEEHLAKQLEAEERRAARSTFLDTWDDGKGTMRGRFAIPILPGDMWLTALNALASPRRPDAYERTDEDGKPKSNSVLLGQALAEYVERYPVDRLPHTGGLSTTLIVNVDAETLMGGLRSADLLTGHQISPGQARRLACEAGILPQVLGGKSQLLDYGRTKRFHTTGQRKVIQARDKNCRADGCDVPATWCHVHHRTPWSKGGSTTIDDALSLCSRHHHKAHDPTYDMRDGPRGKVTFTRNRQ